MSRIESSLGSGSVTNLPSRGQVSQDPPSSAHRLRSQLEHQSAALKGLHDDLTQMKLSEHLESNSSVAELEAQVIKRRKQMNKKKDQLKRIQYDGKIDAMISLAEIEFSVEKDQVEMLSLSQKIKDLNLEECRKDGPKQESLFSLIPENKKMVLVTRTLDRKQLVSGVRMRREGAGLELISDMSGTRGLRILEVNGQHVLWVQEMRWREMRESLEYPAKIVLMTDESDNYKLTEDMAAIQTRLNQKLREGRHVSQELATVQAEREALTRVNTCLLARVAQLEAQNQSLQTGMRHVRDSLATCLNNGVLHTLNKLDTCHERHVGHDSSSTSGICSAEDGSDGSSSSQYNSWRESQGQSSLEEIKSRITERSNIETVWTHESAPAPTVAALRQRLGEETIYENLKLPEIKNTKLDRANSTVHRVSNLIRWPRNKFKHQQEKKVLSNFV